MTNELKILQKEFNQLADSYFLSNEAKQAWFERKHIMALGNKKPSELYSTKQGVIILIEELYKIKSGNVA